MGYRGKKVLVTGADGFIGSHLVESLVAAGAEVTALSLYHASDTHGWLDDLTEDVLAPVRLIIWVFMPITLPCRSRSGPPELPGFMGASVWMT